MIRRVLAGLLALITVISCATVYAFAASVYFDFSDDSFKWSGISSDMGKYYISLYNAETDELIEEATVEKSALAYSFGELPKGSYYAIVSNGRTEIKSSPVEITADTKISIHNEITGSYYSRTIEKIVKWEALESNAEYTVHIYEKGKLRRTITTKDTEVSLKDVEAFTDEISIFCGDVLIGKIGIEHNLTFLVQDGVLIIQGASNKGEFRFDFIGENGKVIKSVEQASREYALEDIPVGAERLIGYIDGNRLNNNDFFLTDIIVQSGNVVTDSVVTGLWAETLGDGIVKLSWDEIDDASYTVQYRKSGSSKWTSMKPRTTNEIKINFGKKADAVYGLKIVVGGNESKIISINPSDEEGTIVWAADTDSEFDTNLYAAIKDADTAKITLSWDDAKDSDSYTVYYRKAGSEKWLGGWSRTGNRITVKFGSAVAYEFKISADGKDSQIFLMPKEMWTNAD